MIPKDAVNKYIFCICFFGCFCHILQAQDSIRKNSHLTLNGFVDAYYSYDLAKPLNHEKPLFIYNHNRHNEITINLALVSLSFKDSTKRANLGLMAGTYPQYNLATEPELLRYIYEANVGVRLARARELWFDAGILPSHIGFESAISKDCWTLTRSLLAENSPYYEAGVRVSYKSLNQKWYIAALALNGWQRIKRVDGNNTPSFGTQVTYTPTENLSINSSTFIGNDKPDSISKWRYFHNFYSIFQLTKRLSLTTGFDVGMEQKSKGSAGVNIWYSPVLIARYNATDKVLVAARAEYYNDKHGVIISTGTPNGFKTFGFSANIDYTIRKGVLYRIEARSLRSGDKMFVGSNTISSNSTWLTTSLSFAF